MTDQQTINIQVARFFLENGLGYGLLQLNQRVFSEMAYRVCLILESSYNTPNQTFMYSDPVGRQTVFARNGRLRVRGDVDPFVADPIESALGSSPEPDSEGCHIFERNDAGEFEPVNPKHHADPFAETEVVAGSAAPAPTGEPAKPQTFLERLRGWSKKDHDVTVYTTGGHTFTGRLVEVTNEVLVLRKEGSELGATILLHKIDYFLPYC